MRLFTTPPHSRKFRSRLANRAQLRVEQLETRVVPYTTSGNVWPHPQLVTISFEPDGTNLGGVSSNLFATFNAKWATNVWENQILRAAQVWAQQTGINFSVITDNGAQIGAGSYQQGDPKMGDIRIGGFNFQSSTLASAYLPPPVNNYSIAGDIEFNTGQPFNIGTTYDLFTVAAHEFGHALGLLHSSTAQAIMYGSYNTRKTALNCDDIAGIQAIYGGVPVNSVSNSTFATATNLTSQINATTLTALVSGLDLTTTSDVDYYTVTAPTAPSGTFTMTVQSTGLSLLDPTVTVYAADQTTVLGSATPNITYRTGSTLTVTVGNVTAGEQMYIKVSPYDTTAFGTGAYAMTLNFGTGTNPTVPLPNTQTANGNPLSTGSGQPDSPPGEDAPGRDAFELPTDAREQGAVSSPQESRRAAPATASVVVEDAVPTLAVTVAKAVPGAAILPVPAAVAVSALRALPSTVAIDALFGGSVSEANGVLAAGEEPEFVPPAAPLPDEPASIEPISTPVATKQAAETLFDDCWTARACDVCFAAYDEPAAAVEEATSQRGAGVEADGAWTAELAAVSCLAVVSGRLGDGRTERRDPWRRALSLS
jgi:hypothetical protein